MNTPLPPCRPVLPFAAGPWRRLRADAAAWGCLAALLGLFWFGLFAGRELVFGTLAVAATTTLCSKLIRLRATRLSVLGLVRFAAYFIIQSVAGGIDVAWRALHPRCPLAAGTWFYRVRLPPGPGRLVFVGCIGLLPGTVGRALQGDRLWVHSIAGDPQAALAALEQRVAAVYGVTLSDAAG